MAYVKNSLNEEFSGLMTLICEASELFQLYDRNRVVVSVSRSRSPGKTGVWAYVQPINKMKLESSGFSEARYIMNFVVPRYFCLTPQERLETVVHEIYHLHPNLNGQIRTFPGPFKHHGPTPAAYKRRVTEIAKTVERNFPEILGHPLLNEGPEKFMSKPMKFFKLVPTLFARPLSFWLLSLVLGVTLSWAQKVPEKITAIKAGNLYEKPEKFAQKKGRIEPGDEFERLGQSPSGAWSKVRLTLTSEEGWYPTSWLKIVVAKVPEVQKKWSSELVGSWIVGDPSWSIGLGAYRNLSSRNLQDSAQAKNNWNRFLVGPEFHFYKAGNTDVSEQSVAVSTSATWWSAGAGTQYVIQFLDSPMKVSLVGSLFYFSRTLSGQGITDEALIQAGLNPSLKGLGFSTGAGLGYSWMPSFETSLRLSYLNMGSSSFAIQGVLGVLF